MASDEKDPTALDAAASGGPGAPLDPANDFLDEEQDAIFKARMKVVDLFLGYWRHALAATGIALLGVGAFGLWQDHERETQQTIHAEVSRVFSKLPDEPTADTDWSVYGAELEAAATTAKGPGAVWAWTQAALLYEESKAEEDALRAWSAADAVGADGVLGWAAAAGHANALGDQGDIEPAAAIYRAWADRGQSLLSEQALFSLATLYRGADRMDESAQVLQEFAQRFPESTLSPQVQQALQEIQGTG